MAYHDFAENSQQNDRIKRSSMWPQPGTDASKLLTTNNHVIISADIISFPSFSIFYNQWISNGNTTLNKPIFIPEFEVACGIDIQKYNILKILNTDSGNDYKPILSAIKTYGNWVWLTNDSLKADRIIAASKEVGSYLRVYRLDRDGKLRNHISPDKRKMAITNTPFELSETTAPLQRVKRYDNRKYRMGDIVFNSQKEPIKLSNEYISNPQSITYYTDKPGVHAKIFEPQFLTVSYFERKIRRMLENPIHIDGICWPIDVLTNASGEFVGALVKEAKGVQLKQLMSQQGLSECFPGWNRLDLTHLVKVVLDKIACLHDANILLGILNPNAIFVEDRDHVFFAEMDTYQIEGYPVLSHNKVMQAPELQDQKEELQLFTKQQDYYEVALLTFMLLMPGKFPYNKGKNKDISESIKKMNFAFRYGKSGEEHGARESFGLWRFVWSHLGNEMKQAFYYTFQSDQLYSAPEQRRDARFWRKKVGDLEQSLISPYDEESLQVFPRTYKRYSWTKTIRCEKCGIDHPVFYYRYPEKKICNSCLGKPSSTYFVCKSCGKSFYYDFGTLFKYQKLVETKSFSMPTHCPYCRADKQRCIDCGELVPSYRINKDGRCPDCAQNARNRIVQRYYGICGHEIALTQGEVDFYMSKFGNLPRKCKNCRERQRRGY